VRAHALPPAFFPFGFELADQRKVSPPAATQRSHHKTSYM
jgi:hypothetical protein